MCDRTRAQRLVQSSWSDVSLGSESPSVECRGSCEATESIDCDEQCGIVDCVVRCDADELCSIPLFLMALGHVRRLDKLGDPIRY